MIRGIMAGMRPNTTFAWIPGHCGVRGNTTADLLTGTGHLGSRYTDSVPLADVKNWSNNGVGQDWASLWNTSFSQEN